MGPVDKRVRADLDRSLCRVEELLSADAVAFVGPIMSGCEQQLRAALDALGPERRPSLAVILDTPGGIVEVVERMVTTIRFLYKDLKIVVPDQAMSAGTIFALSADRIMMDHLSCLGPIDPQIEKDGKLVPALSYLNQFERLNQKATDGALTTAEYALLDKLDLGELYQFDQARALSNELLIKWLSTYRFKNWNVTLEVKECQARNSAALLNDPERWHSHGRAIDRRTLREEVNLTIDDLEESHDLYTHIRDYFGLLKDYMRRESIFLFTHSRGYF